ncbi:hypothetical protein F3Y22_tig00117016pilonHSYRG00391 [Hibiscus syriacus]|uniref:4-alpha-glucanotransferase n=1 Tax=Hibiscus syriacus TaxID=106335 RepID=A0A6A2XPT3_HIBSY|nr:hypothetical protein F3Y22_tig00117016pilonHSYRG00391 [Hibiscus syriacus]
MFVVICTRPDIAQAVGVVSRYMENACKEHWNTIKRILRYIKWTSNVALYYGGSNLLINGYVDSDYVGDLDKNKSTTGYVFKFAGGAVNWVSKLQSVMATSTTEAEYVAATHVSKEAIWLKMLLEELGHNQDFVPFSLALGFGSDYRNPHMPHNHESNQVVYTGTHDNDTIQGWWSNLMEQERSNVLKYLRITEKDEIAWALIQAAAAPIAQTAVITTLDVLGLDGSARMNIPATQHGNWSWRIPNSMSFDTLETEALRLRDMVSMYGRM